MYFLYKNIKGKSHPVLIQCTTMATLLNTENFGAIYISIPEDNKYKLITSLYL